MAAGPTTSIREEPYQWEVMRDHGIVGVIGKGGMGPKTLEGVKNTVVFIFMPSVELLKF